MDTITHGIAGALLGKAFYADKQGRVATFAATLGAVFPDSDAFFNLFDRNELATIELHRGVTHSFVCLPFFAAGLAALTRWYARRRGWVCPSWLLLAGIYATGLTLHIVLDLITSFGTMIWSPLANTRATWDMVFILDSVLTGIVLLPQAAAWVYRKPNRSFRRALGLWVLFAACAAAIERIARAVGFPFSPWVVVAVSLLLAGLFFLPAARGWGFAVRRASWCRAGVFALAAYLGACAVAHHAALARVEQFAASRGVRAERLGALPLPPALLHWNGLIRVPDGVHQARIDLRGRAAPEFHFFPDAPANGYIEAARQLPKVQSYLRFARFPVIRYLAQGDQHVIEIADLQFFRRRNGRPNPFTFRVRLDASGRVVEQGWADVLDLRRIHAGDLRRD